MICIFKQELSSWGPALLGPKLKDNSSVKPTWIDQRRAGGRCLNGVHFINTYDCERRTDEGERAAQRREELPPENSLLIRLLLHLLIASHWGCREISVACHYACRSDFSFTQLAYRCTIWSGCVCDSLLLFLSPSLCLAHFNGNLSELLGK